MSVIVMLKSDEGVYVASDSLIVCGSTALPSTIKKYFLCGSFGVGAAGAVGALNAIQTLAKSKNKGRVDVAGFANELKKTLKEKDLTSFESDRQARTADCNELFTDGKDIWLISYDFSVTKISDQYFSIGSGSSYAIGSLASIMQNKKMSGIQAKKEIRKAIKAAIKFDIYCGGKIFIDKVGG